MSSSSGDDDTGETLGERGSPPLRFVCFRPRFWKRRKALPTLSSKTAAVNSASSVAVSAGEPGDSAPVWTAPALRDSKDSDLMSKPRAEGSNMFLNYGHSFTDASEKQEEDYRSPSTELIKATETMTDLMSRPRAEGSNVLFRHGHSIADVSEKREQDYRSPSTELITATGTRADAQQQRARPLSWDAVCHELDHLILRHVPSFYDRCRLRCVCHRWQDATRMFPLPPRPLPMVINSDFTLLNCFADGPLAIAREIKSPAMMLDDQHTGCVGCLDDWIVCVYPRAWNARQSVLLSDQYCYMLAPSKQKLIELPNPPAFQATRRIQGLIQVENGSTAISYAQPSYATDITLSKVVLTTAPDIGNCKVAAMSERRGGHHLAVCMIGMSSWCFYSADFITIGTDLEFFEDSLYLLANDNADLFVFEFGPQLCLFPVVTHAERCLIDKLPDLSDDNGVHSCNLVQWNKRLLLVIRKFPDMIEQMTGVDVLILDNKSKPWKWVKTNTLKGHCILISSAHNQSYPAYLYDDIEEDTIYFLDNMNPGFLPREDENFTYQVLVYNMQCKKISTLRIGNKPAGSAMKFPVRFCPAE